MQLTKEQIKVNTLAVNVSDSHIHLSRGHINRLFGDGYRLTPGRELAGGRFIAKETLAILTPAGKLGNIRIAGLERAQTQVELTWPDAIALGLKPPVRESGLLRGSPGAILAGPAGSVEISEGVIIAKRHVHITREDAARRGLKGGDTVRVFCGGDKRLIFDNVAVRLTPGVAPQLHIDRDEASAAMLRPGDMVQVVQIVL